MPRVIMRLEDRVVPSVAKEVVAVHKHGELGFPGGNVVTTA